MDKTIDDFLSVVWFNSEYGSVQLSSHLFIYSFILICNLALTRLYTYTEVYYAKLK